MTAQTKSTIWDIFKGISAAAVVIGAVFAAGGFVNATKQANIDLIEHEKVDADFQKEVSNSLKDLQITTAKMNQTLDYLKESSKRNRREAR